MMKRILLIAISLNIIATPTQAKPAVGRQRAVYYSRPDSFPSRFHHYKLPRNPYDPSVGGMTSVATENVMAGVRNIGSWIGDQIQYVAGKGKELADSVASIIKPAMNTLKLSDSGSRATINAWQSGFVSARDQQTKRMRKKAEQKMPTVQVAEQEAVTFDEPSPSLIISEPAEIEPLINIEHEPVEAIEVEEVSVPEKVAVPATRLPIITQPAFDTTLPEQSESPAVVTEIKETMQPEPVSEPPVVVTEVKEVMEPESVSELRVIQESVVVTPVLPTPVQLENVQPMQAPLEQSKKKKKKMLMKEELVTEEEEYQPVRKKRRPVVVDQDDIDIFKLQSEFARSTAAPSYQPSSFMNAPQPMPVYQQQVPIQQQQPMQFSAAPVYQPNQSQLSNAAMQMQSSAMAMQMQAANLMAQSQQQPYMQPMVVQQAPMINQMQPMPQYNQTMQQFNSSGLSTQEKTKQLMQYLYQLHESGEHNGQRVLLLIDLELDIIEHLLAGNTGQMVELSVHERNVALKNSNQMVIAVYNMILDQATSCGARDGNDHLYQHFVRKSKRLKQSSIAPKGKRKFLMCVMYVLERYYKILEKMQNLTTTN